MTMVMLPVSLVPNESGETAAKMMKNKAEIGVSPPNEISLAAQKEL